MSEDQKYTPPQKKVPRDVELKNTMRLLVDAQAKTLSEAAALTAKVRREAVFKATAASGVNNTHRIAALAKVKQALDQSERDLDKHHATTIKQVNTATSDARRNLKKAFEAERDRLEAEMTAKNRPIEEAYRAHDAELIAENAKQAAASKRSLDDALAPLIAELQGIEEVLAAKKTKAVEAIQAAAPQAP